MSLLKPIKIDIYKMSNREYYKKWCLDNKKQIALYTKQYYKLNKHKFKEYYELNKEKNKKQTICDCGGNYQLRNKIRHDKTKKHLKYLENQEQIYIFVST